MRTNTQPSSTGAYNVLLEITNGETSDYNALQVQFRKRLSATVQMQLSYTWSHSIDSSSTDFGFGGGFATLFNSGQRGDSDYDIRQNVTFSGSWRLPSPSNGAIFNPIRHWYVDFLAAAHTPLPFDLQGVSTDTSCSSSSTTSCSNTGGLFAQVRPDWDGEAIWVFDPNAPDRKRLNPNAFVIPSGYEQGTLGRNSLRGFGFAQLDLAVRRTIPLGERLQINIVGEGYNILNHPNFANPSPLEGANLSSPNFGVATQMLNQSFGGGVNSLYRSGGPRSMELSLRLQF